MASLDQYANKALAAHPEIIESFIDQDLNAAYASHAEAAQAISDLTALKAQLHPEQASAGEAISEATAEDQPQG